MGRYFWAERFDDTFEWSRAGKMIEKGLGWDVEADLMRRN